MRGTAISNWVIVWSPKLVQARSNKVRATINFLLLYQGSNPLNTAPPVLVNCATSAGWMGHQCWSNCATCAGHTVPPLLVNCATSAGRCATSAGNTTPPVLIALHHQCWSNCATHDDQLHHPWWSTAPPVLVKLHHQCWSNCATVMVKLLVLTDVVNYTLWTEF
jgi:hypothetical protein